jgi:hypothetical protein
MSPYEISHPGGSVEHMNPESGEVWMRRLLQQFRHAVWLNPVAEQYWDYTPSLQMMHKLLQQRMYPLTLDGVDRAMRSLKQTAAALPPT